MASPPPGAGIVVRPSAYEPGKPQHLMSEGPLLVRQLALEPGQSLPEHRAPGVLLVECLEGHVQFRIGATDHQLETGALLLVPDRAPHSVEAVVSSRLRLVIARTDPPA